MQQTTAENTANRTQNEAVANFNNNFRAATDSLRSAFETGIRFQQDAVRSMNDFARMESFEDARVRVQDVATDSINMFRKNAEEAQNMIEHNCKAGVEMLKRTFGMLDTNAKNRDNVAQTREIWNTAFNTMKNNVDTAARMGTQAIESWSSMFNNCTCMGSGEKKNVSR
jgi:hypothetical protein